MIKEKWKDIPGYEGVYQISNTGKVKSLSRQVSHSRYGVQNLNERVMKTNFDYKGYERITLHKPSKTFRIHQLIAMAFLGHQLNGHKDLIVDHINNDHTDNRLENLQLITHRENVSKDRGRDFTGVYLHKPTGKWTAKISIDYNLKHLGSFDTPEEASKVYQDALFNILKK